jgi:hypothetical protein
MVASAAGVGILALSPIAEAKVVYTPSHIGLGFDQVTPIDLNHDGVTDFNVYALYGDSSDGGGNSFQVLAGQRYNAIVGYASHSGHKRPLASALRAGARIGNAADARAFVAGGLMASALYRRFPKHTSFGGPWANGGKGVRNRYLGLRFFVKGKVHYGWARLNVSCSNGEVSGTLTGYAYETIPGKSIIAGQTKGTDDLRMEEPNASLTAPTTQSGTLGILAMGAPALAIWRREE